MEPIKQSVENNLDSFAFQNYHMGELSAAWETKSPARSTEKLHMAVLEGGLKIGRWFTLMEG